jgi:SulP family sulfate permease
MDCSLVLGIDSSAAHAIVKLKDLILKYYNIQLIVFVTGSKDGFPTEYKLREHLSPPATSQDFPAHCASEVTYLLEEKMHIRSIVCDSLDLALMEAEDALIARQNPTLVYEDNLIFAPLDKKENMTEEDERHECISCLKEICPLTMSDEDAKELFSCFKREEYQHHNQVWVQGDESDSLKLVVSGQLVAELENEAGTTEIVTRNNIVGELGLVNGDPRMSTLRVTSDKAVLYSMSRESFEILIESNPRVARYIDRICVKHLALRVQHVSNRIFETRCLPI